MIYQEYSINFGESVILMLIFCCYFMFFYLIIKSIWKFYYTRKGWGDSDFKNLAVTIVVLVNTVVIVSFYWDLLILLFISSAIFIVGIIWLLRIKQKKEFREILPLFIITECIILLHAIAFYYSLLYYLDLAHNMQILPI